MSTLFDYVKAIDDIIIANTDEDGVIDEEAIKDELEALELARDDKINNCISFIKSRKAIAEALKNEKQAIARRQQIAENEAERVKDYLVYCLGGKKWESTAGQVSYRRSEAVEIEDLSEVPEEFLKYEVSADKTAIKKALKEGKDIQGAHLEERVSTIIK